MTSRKILVPVFDSSSSLEIARDSFWIARYQPAELHIVEIYTPVGFFKWLCTPLIKRLKRLRSSQTQEAQQKALKQEVFPCRIGELEAPNLILGIVEAACSNEASTIVILPEINESIGKSGINELKDRLSEISSFVLLRISKEGYVRVEPGKKKILFDVGNVIPIDKHRWGV
jgi:hypothetical protein